MGYALFLPFNLVDKCMATGTVRQRSVRHLRKEEQ